jgi:hypothetical protein
MSVTITKQPPFINPVFNPIVIQAKSTEQTRTDFKYVCVVRDDGGAPLGRLEKFGGTSVNDVVNFDVSGVLKRRHNFDFWRYNVTGSDYIYRASAYKIGFNVTIYEYYNGALQGSAVITTAATLPMALSTIRFANFSYNDEIKNNKGKWLTNFDKIKVRPTDKITMSFLNGVEGCVAFHYYFYNGDTLLTSVTKYNPYASSAGATAGFEDVYHLHAGLQEIAAYCGISNANRDATTRYVIKQNNIKSLEFEVIPEDCRFDGVRVHYLNEWGAVDSFLFGLAARRGVTIEKKKAKLPFSDTPLRPSIYGVGTSPYVVKFTDTLRLTSDYITENDSNALLEMFTSPIVSVETEQRLFVPNAAKGTKIILPADIDLTSYDIKQSSLDRLFNLELEIKIAVDNTRQSL